MENLKFNFDIDLTQLVWTGFYSLGAERIFNFNAKSKSCICIFHIRTVYLDIIKVLFIHQLMHQWVVLKNNIKIYIKTAPTYFGAVKPSSGSALILAY